MGFENGTNDEQVVNNRLSLNFASRDVVSSAPHPHGIIFAASSKSALDISFNVAGELGIIIFHFSPKVKEQQRRGGGRTFRCTQQGK